MKIIEGLKKLKELRRKQDDLIGKINENSALLSYQTPPYGDKQAEKVAGFVQAVEDIGKEILAINVAIQKTNLETEVEIELGENMVKRTISEWILRRRSLCEIDERAYGALNTNGLREGALPSRGAGQEVEQVKIIRFFEQELRDKHLAVLQDEPGRIDARLEVVNAVTDLIGYGEG